MPHVNPIPTNFLTDTALRPLRARSGPVSRKAPVFFYFYVQDMKVVGCDGLSQMYINPALFSHFIPVFLELVEKKGRGAIFSAINSGETNRSVLLTDNHNNTASILDVKLAQALAATVNYPEYVQPG